VNPLAIDERSQADSFPSSRPAFNLNSSLRGVWSLNDVSGWFFARLEGGGSI